MKDKHENLDQRFRPKEDEVSIGALGPVPEEPVRLDDDPGRNYGGLPGVEVELPEGSEDDAGPDVVERKGARFVSPDDEEPFLFTDPPRDVPVDAVKLEIEFVTPAEDEEPFLFTDPPRGMRIRLLP